MKLGDAVATVATPIARTLHMDCIDPETQQLKPDAPCNKRIQRLNDFSDAVYDGLFALKRKLNREKNNARNTTTEISGNNHG